jgi:hypothetical protein
MIEIKIDTQKLAKELTPHIEKTLLPQINQIVENALIHHLYDDKIKGYNKASKITHTTQSALKKRVLRGYYQKDIAYSKDDTNQSQIVFDKSKLLELEKDRESKIQYYRTNLDK